MLKGKKISLHAMELSDLDLLYDWENNTENWAVSGTLAPFSKLILRQFVESPQDIFANKQQRLMIRTVAENSVTIGCIDLFEFDPKNKRAGIGVLIADKKWRGKGYAKEAILLIVDYAREVLDLNQLFCNVGMNNEKSLHLFKSCNFELVGVKKEWQKWNGNWEDEAMFQLFL